MYLSFGKFIPLWHGWRANVSVDSGADRRKAEMLLLAAGDDLWNAYTGRFPYTIATAWQAEMVGETVPELVFFNLALTIDRDFPGMGLAVNGATYVSY
jgi:hypothetical protein